MMDRSAPRAYGFHDGERAVQQRAGVGAAAARLEGMLGPAALGPGVARFFGEPTFAAICASDRGGLLWVSPLVGPPGFLQVTSPTSLEIARAPGDRDPLFDPPVPQHVGLIAIDYGRRRRFRLNGTLCATSPRSMTISVDEAFGNCPQFIPQRTIEAVPAEQAPATMRAEGSKGPDRLLTRADHEIIGRADTFIFGTSHPQRGNDASHRGGPPGFVRIDRDDTDRGTRLWWPDYAGNNLFNSLGNLAVDPHAALLFLDFPTHTSLHITGKARLEFLEVGSPGDDGHTGRHVVVTPHRVTRRPLSATSTLLARYPDNPPVSDPPVAREEAS